MGISQKKKQVQTGSNSSNINISTVSECTHECTTCVLVHAHNNSNIGQHSHKGPGPVLLNFNKGKNITL